MSSTSHYGAGSLSRDRPGGEEQAAVLHPDNQGRVLFDFRIGITGHWRLDDAESLISAIREAKRSMREEASDWFGAMRFHDIEPITQPGRCG